jgi:hypothetical protein
LVNVAESVTEPPAVIVLDERVVVIVGVVLFTVRGSQADVTAALPFASPL